jgi:tetratricopeptide (TPR) repeat protein
MTGRARRKASWVWLLAVAMGLAVLIGLTGCREKEGTPAVAMTPTSGPGGSADEHFAAGNTAYQQGDLAKAAAEFAAALQIQPSHIGSLTNLGVVYYQQGQLDAAATQFETGLKVDPNDAQLHYLLGATRLQQSRYEEAESSFLKANGLKPDLAEVQYGLGALYKLQGKTDEAIAAFERFLELGTAQDPQAAGQAQQELRELRGQ